MIGQAFSASKAISVFVLKLTLVNNFHLKLTLLFLEEAFLLYFYVLVLCMKRYLYCMVDDTKPSNTYPLQPRYGWEKECRIIWLSCGTRPILHSILLLFRASIHHNGHNEKLTRSTLSFVNCIKMVLVS